MDRSCDLDEFQLVEENQLGESFIIDNALPTGSETLGAAIYLSDSGNNDKLPDGLLEHDITFKKLASLSDKDLELLGISDERVRLEKLEDYSELPNQDPYFHEVFSATNIEQYKNDVLLGMAEHIENLRTSIAAAEYKLLVFPCEDVLIGDTTYSSEYVLRVLDEITQKADQIQSKLMQLKQGKMEKSGGKFNTISKLVLAAGVGGAVYIIFKFLKAKLK